jgi:hypothetical protein
MSTDFRSRSNLLFENVFVEIVNFDILVAATLNCAKSLAIIIARADLLREIKEKDQLRYIDSPFRFSLLFAYKGEKTASENVFFSHTSVGEREKLFSKQTTC